MTDRGAILVVDDDSESLRLLTGILTDEGYQVRPADSGELALAFIETKLPELILLDIGMPGMDGFEVCRRLKASDRTNHIPLMFLSGAGEEERVEGLRLGAVDFVAKPFRREELLARVSTHLELGRLRTQLEQQVVQQTEELRAANEQLQNDLLERGLAEQALRESEERFREMADTAPVSIWIAGPDQLITFVNKQTLVFTGRTKDQLMGRGWLENVHPEDRDRYLSIHGSAVQTQSNFRTELRARRADGKYRWFMITGTPRLRGSSYAGHIGTAIDITHVKRRHEEMLTTQKLESLGVMAAGIAHNFNNMLGSILGETDLALSDCPEDAPVCGHLKTIEAAAIRAAGVVNQLMACAGGDDSGRTEPINLSLLIQEMLPMLKVCIPPNTVLETNLPKDLPPVWVNGTQIRQVIVNLITNATEALGGEAGQIHVTAGRIGDHLRLQISDTGCGISTEARSRVFDPFYSTKFLGRGLGLSAVHGIVRAHGGAINVRSAPGAGSIFEVLLPYARPKAHNNSFTSPTQIVCMLHDGALEASPLNSMA